MFPPNERKFVVGQKLGLPIGGGELHKSLEVLVNEADKFYNHDAKLLAKYMHIVNFEIVEIISYKEAVRKIKIDKL